MEVNINANVTSVFGLYKHVFDPIEFFLIEFYRMHRIYKNCRILLLVILKTKVIKNSIL